MADIMCVVEYVSESICYERRKKPKKMVILIRYVIYGFVFLDLTYNQIDVPAYTLKGVVTLLVLNLLAHVSFSKGSGPLACKILLCIPRSMIYYEKISRRVSFDATLITLVSVAPLFKYILAGILFK